MNEPRNASARALYEKHSHGAVPRRRQMRMGEVGHWQLAPEMGETESAPTRQAASRLCQIGQNHYRATP